MQQPSSHAGPFAGRRMLAGFIHAGACADILRCAACEARVPSLCLLLAGMACIAAGSRNSETCPVHCGRVASAATA
eukprot:scaffold1727_cov119-Isochrysis_galbana.AAC.2